jgi:hypothetical protein
MTAYPSGLIPSVGPLSPSAMITTANEWLVALKTSGASTTAPADPVDGQIWYDSSNRKLKLWDDGVWLLLLSDVGPTVTDLDTAITDGPFRFGTAAANSPFSGFAGSGVTFARPSGATQLAFAQKSNGTDRIWTRASLNADGTSWSAWVRAITQADIVGTVSRSGGVPAGGVIESDVLGSGHYVRFADGTQICHSTRNLSRDSASQLHNLWTFPKAFVNADYRVTFGHRNLSGAPAPTQLGLPRIGDTATGTQLRTVLPRIFGMTDFGSGDTAELDVTVHGRWVAP